METLQWLLHSILHVDETIDWILQTYGTWTYLILGAVIFAETGLVVTPFLPGDSLLFAAGVFGARGALNPHLLFVTLTLAAILGDNTNYWIGRFLGPRVLKNEKSRIFKRSYLDRTHAYFEKYGAATIVIARFVPVVRTFAPFVAGVGAMSYPKYVAYSIGGAILWVGVCVYAGYLLGGIPAVKNNFEIAVLVILSFSLLIPLIEWLRRRFGGGEAH